MERVQSNIHHIHNTRASHNSNPASAKIRRQLGQMARLYYDSHIELHQNCPAVPVLPHHLAASVLKLYVPHGDPLVGMDNYVSAVQEATKSPRLHRIELELAELNIEAVMAQRPYIRSGLVDREW